MKKLLCLITILALMPFPQAAAEQVCTVRIDFSKTAQNIEGISGNFAKNRMSESAIANGKNDAVGEQCIDKLNPQHVRVGIPLKDFANIKGNQYDGGYVHSNFELMADFTRQNRIITASVWDIPDRMVKNPSSSTQRIVKDDMYGELADELANFVLYSKDTYGIKISYLSFNESNGGINVLMSGAQYADIIKRTAAKLEAYGIRDIKWLAGDTSNSAEAYNFARAQLSDAQCLRYIGAISYHSWDVNDADVSALENIKSLGDEFGLPVWVGEVGYDSGLYAKPDYDAITKSWTGANYLGINYYKALKYTGASNLFYWQYQWDYNLLDIYGNLYPGFYFVKQLRETLLPGMTVIDASSSSDNVNAVAAFDDKSVTVNLWNTSSQPVTVNVENLPNVQCGIISSGEGGAYTTRNEIIRGNAVSLVLEQKSMTTIRITVNDDSITSFINGGNFISVKDGRLYDGDEMFRGIGFNLPGLTLIEDGNPQYIIPDEYEISDAFLSLSQMGVNVIRVNMLGIRKTTGQYGIPDGLPANIVGKGQYSEQTFEAFDIMLQKANAYGIKVIMPGIDGQRWWGGIYAYCDMYKKPVSQFFTDAEMKNGIKNLYNYMVNRVNTKTGIKYKDDKAILAWQLGNEIESTGSPQYEIDAWSSEIAAYIKSIDSNHLVADGRHLGWDGVINDSSIDIVDSHYYPMHSQPNPLVRLSTDMTKARNKALMVGEIGFYKTDVMNEFLSSFIAGNGSLCMMWSLRFHSRTGGFYYHREMEIGDVSYSSYHWPGFASGASYDETNMLSLFRNKAYEIRGLAVPALPVPKPPRLLNSGKNIYWQGAAGAASYDLQRSEPGGTWIYVARDITDDCNTAAGDVMFTDTGVQQGKTYYYRMCSKNSSGCSEFSNIISVSYSSILENGSFENGFNSWTPYGNGVNVTQSEARSGQSSLRINGVGTTGDSANWGDIYQLITPEKTGVYAISGYMKSNATDASEAWRTKMMIRPSYSNDENDNIATVIPSDFAFEFPISDWRYFSFNVNLTAGVEYAFYIKANTGGTANTYYYDDLSITKELSESDFPEPDTSAGLYVDLNRNIVSNGDFESGSTDWVSDYWSKGVSSIVNNGVSAHLYMSDSDPDEWFNVRQMISVEPYTDYIFSLKGKVAYASSIWGVYMKFTVGNENGADLCEPFNMNTAKNEWTDYTYTFNSGANTALCLYIGGNNSTFEADDIRIKKADDFGVSINETDGGVTGAETRIISGNTSSTAYVSAKINSVTYTSLTYGENNTFIIEAKLRYGINDIELTADDGNGHERTVCFSLYRQDITAELNEFDGKAGVKITNISGIQQTMSAVIAAYKGKKLTGIYIKAAKIQPGADTEFSFTPPEYDDLKVFVYYDLINMTPYVMKETCDVSLKI